MSTAFAGTTQTTQTMRRLRYTFVLLLLCGLLMLFGHTSALAAPTITTDLKNGDKVSDVATIVAKVDGTDIEKVEFSVDDKLRFTGPSIPYEFVWDTLPEKEGAHTIVIVATDAAGKTTKAALSLVVDNELSKGAEALAQQASDALAKNDTDTARRYSRRALKVDPDNLSAARIQARLLANGQDFDKAISTLETNKSLDKSSAGLLELASYRLRRALIPENAATFIAEVQEVGALRRKAADLGVAEVKKSAGSADTVAAHESIGDALIAAGRFPEAITEYQKAAIGDDASMTSVNRLALAYVLNSQENDAEVLIKPYRTAKKDDAQMRAVLGLALLRRQQFAAAKAIVATDAMNRVPASLVVASYADLTNSNRRDAINEATDAIRMLPASGEAQYAFSLASTNVLDSESAILKTLSLSPFQSGPYLNYAARVALQKGANRYEQSLNLTDYVLKSDPKNLNAKLIQATILMQTNRIPEAFAILTYLYKNGPKTADLLLTISAYYRTKMDSAKTTEYLEAATKLDPMRFDFQLPPGALETLRVLNRKLAYRVDFYLSPATLYPATAQSASAQ